MIQLLQYLLYAASLSCLFMAFTVIFAYFKPMKRANLGYSFTDLLDYGYLLEHNTILLKNGFLMKIYKLEPKCHRFLPDSDQSHQHDIIARAINDLDGQFMLNVDIIRKKAKPCDKETSYFGPKIFSLLFSKRNELHQGCFTNEYYLSITKTDERYSLVDKHHKYETVFSDFQKQTSNFVSKLSSVLNLQECTFCKNLPYISHEAVNFLYQAVNFEAIKLSLPKCEFTLDELLSCHDFVHSYPSKLDDKYICSIAINGFPYDSYFGMLNELNKLNFNYRFSTRFVSFNSFKSNLLLERKRRLWVQKRRGFLNQLLDKTPREDEINEDAQDQLIDLKDAKRNLAQNKSSYGSYTAQILMLDKDLEELNKDAQKVIKSLSTLGFTGHLETYNTTEAYLGSLPGHTLENVRRHTISNVVLSDLLPIGGSFTGELYSPNKRFGDKAPYLMAVTNDENRMSYLNLHVQDLANCFVVGPTGAGKSVLLGSLIISLLRYKGLKVYAFEKGYSFYALTKAALGHHYVLRNNDQLQLCPLHDLSTEALRNRAVNYVMFLLELSGIENLAKVKEEVTNAIENIYKAKLGTNTTATLTDVKQYLCNSEITDYLDCFLSNSHQRHILDGEHNPNLEAPINTFELGEFLSSNKQDVQAVLACLFMLIEDAVVKNEATAIVIDEAWLMLSHDKFSKKILEWLKTFRKYNVTIILATQSIGDLCQNESFSLFLDTIKTRIFLPNPDANNEILTPIYKKLSLNDKQILSISKATPKKDLFLHKDGEFMPFNLLLSKEELALLSLSEKDKKRVDKLYKTHQDAFVWSL